VIVQSQEMDITRESIVPSLGATRYTIGPDRRAASTVLISQYWRNRYPHKERRRFPTRRCIGLWRKLRHHYAESRLREFSEFPGGLLGTDSYVKLIDTLVPRLAAALK
jgi:hypothetical protein